MGLFARWASLVDQWSRIHHLPMQETKVRSLGREDPLEREIATHSSILVWETPRQKSLAGYSPLGHKSRDKTEATKQQFARCSERWTCISSAEPFAPRNSHIEPQLGGHISFRLKVRSPRCGDDCLLNLVPQVNSNVVILYSEATAYQSLSLTHQNHT